MELDIEEYQSMLRIDKDDLDTAIMEQADVFYRVAEAYAEARDHLDAMKDDIDQVDSHLALMYRQKAEAAGEKTTEGKITSLVLVDDKHIAAITAHREAKLRAEQLGALRDSFNQRSSMLRELTNLYVSGYFTLSSAKSSSTKQADARADLGRRALSSNRKPLTKQE